MVVQYACGFIWGYRDFWLFRGTADPMKSVDIRLSSNGTDPVCVCGIAKPAFCNFCYVNKPISSTPTKWDNKHCYIMSTHQVLPLDLVIAAGLGAQLWVCLRFHIVYQVA